MLCAHISSCSSVERASALDVMGTTKANGVDSSSGGTVNF